MTHAQITGGGILPVRGGSDWPLARREAAALMRLAVPIAIIALINVAMSITDTVMIGWFFGTGAVAAVAVGSDLYSIFLYFGMGLVGASRPLSPARLPEPPARISPGTGAADAGWWRSWQGCSARCSGVRRTSCRRSASTLHFWPTDGATHRRWR